MKITLKSYGCGWWMIYASIFFGSYLGAAKTWRGAWQHVRKVLK